MMIALARAGDRLSASEETPNLMLRRARKSHSIDRVFLHPSIAAHARLVVLMSATWPPRPRRWTRRTPRPSRRTRTAWCTPPARRTARTIHVYPVTNYSFGSKAAGGEGRHRGGGDGTAEGDVPEGGHAAHCVRAPVNQRGTRRVCARARGVRCPGADCGRARARSALARCCTTNCRPWSPSCDKKSGRRRVRRAVVSPEPRAELLPVPPRTPGRSPSRCSSPNCPTSAWRRAENTKLLAVPLFEMYGNEQRYGALIASIPHLVSRYNMQLEDE